MVHSSLVSKAISIASKFHAPKHVAIIYSSKNKILGIGLNNDRGSALGISELSSVHAEVDALMSVYGSNARNIIKYVLHNKRARKPKKLKKSSLLVIRSNHTCVLSNSKCCCLCVSFMKKFAINKISYSTADGTVIDTNLREITSFISSGLRIHLAVIDGHSKVWALIERDLVRVQVEKPKKRKFLYDYSIVDT